MEKTQQEQKEVSTSVKQTTTAPGTNLKSGEEISVQNITIPNSMFGVKYVKKKGYAVGYENIKLTEDYETLEEALNQIGYGVDEDEQGDEILVKFGEVDFETIGRIVKAMLIINNENKCEE